LYLTFPVTQGHLTPCFLQQKLWPEAVLRLFTTLHRPRSMCPPLSSSNTTAEQLQQRQSIAGSGTCFLQPKDMSCTIGPWPWPLVTAFLGCNTATCNW
jgi:hypothetical protein